MKKFSLQIITPEKLFFDAAAEAVVFESTDGEMEILADHAPMVAHIEIGELRIQSGGQWRKAFTAQGFVETLPGLARVFSQACEWPEEIDVARAQQALGRYEELLSSAGNPEERSHAQQMIERTNIRLEMAHASADQKEHRE